MDWIAKIAKIIAQLFLSSDCDDKEKPYPVNSRWIGIERKGVDDALKKKHGDND